jgi:hypothetical protein
VGGPCAAGRPPAAGAAAAAAQRRARHARAPPALSLACTARPSPGLTTACLPASPAPSPRRRQHLWPRQRQRLQQRGWRRRGGAAGAQVARHRPLAGPGAGGRQLALPRAGGLAPLHRAGARRGTAQAGGPLELLLRAALGGAGGGRAAWRSCLPAPVPSFSAALSPPTSANLSRAQLISLAPTAGARGAQAAQQLLAGGGIGRRACPGGGQAAAADHSAAQAAAARQEGAAAAGRRCAAACPAGCCVLLGPGGAAVRSTCSAGPALGVDPSRPKRRRQPALAVLLRWRAVR